MPITDAALCYAHAGRSVFPVKPGTKGPRGPWKQYQSRIASDDQIHKWFNDQHVGICILTGEVSGGADGDGTICGLEILDCDDAETLDRFLDLAEASGLSELLSRLPSEQTPRRGQHWGWRCTAWGGNQSLARREETIGTEGSPKRIKTLLEIKGEGGSCTVSPTPLGIHPHHPDRIYEMIYGTWVEVPIITPDERESILNLAKSLNEYTPPAAAFKANLRSGPVVNGDRPGDILNQDADAAWWRELLERHGWVYLYQRADVSYWQKPGKGERDKRVSATLGATGNAFYVFSTSAYPFEAERAYAPFTALTMLDFDGDFKASAKSLAPASRVLPNHDRGTSSIDAELEQAIALDESRYPDIQLEVTDKGKVQESLGNYFRMFSLHEKWKGRLRYNTFARRQELDGEPMTNHQRIAMGIWACQTYQIKGAYNKMRDDAIAHVCQLSPYDPLMDFIDQLPEWDGTKRLPYWMIMWCGAEDSPYSSWVGKMMLTQMVVRAMNPGSIARYVAVLEGAEETGKSQLVMTLGHPWSITFDMSMDQKEAHMAIQGAWVAELAELDTLRRTTETRLKSFVAQSSDNFVPKYSNDREDIPRRCVFVGTTNEDHYLMGETGNTRFLPIKTGQIDLDAIREHRLQLLSEAKTFFETNLTSWWQPLDTLQPRLKDERDSRRIVNVYEQGLGLWLDGYNENGKEAPDRSPVDETSWEVIARDYLQIERKEWKDKSLQMQIASALKANGWARELKSAEKGRMRIWRRQS